MPYMHITGLMVLRAGDNVTTHVLNPGTALEGTRIRIFADRGARLLSDSGDLKISPRATNATSFALATAEEVWVEIEATSEILVPMVYFVRPGVPTYQILELFKGGDFAVFDPAGKRLW